jgi:hypothetical protein
VRYVKQIGKFPTIRAEFPPLKHRNGNNPVYSGSISSFLVSNRICLFGIHFCISNLLKIITPNVSSFGLQVSQHFFSYIMTRTFFILMRWWCSSLCTRTTCLVLDFIVLAHLDNSPRVNMSHHSDTLSWFRANKSFCLILCVL